MTNGLNGEIKVFSGRSNPELAKRVVDNLGIELGNVKCRNFSDGELSVSLQDNVRGKDVFIIQSTSYPQNDNLMELLLIADAARRRSARRIVAVVSYLGYSRQDRTFERSPISAKIVARMIESVGIDKLFTFDLHSEQIQGFYDISVDNLHVLPFFLEKIRKMKLRNPIIVAPDSGSVVRSKRCAEILGYDLAIINKSRPHPNACDVIGLLGDVEGKDCILLDDLADTFGTLSNAANTLVNNGANNVSAFVTHGVLSGYAVNKINNSHLNKLYITNSIKQPDHIASNDKIEILDISKILSESVYRIHNNKSFNNIHTLEL